MSGNPIAYAQRGLLRLFEVTQIVRSHINLLFPYNLIGMIENGCGNIGVEEASMTIHILERA
jgi:hypothetical protein